MGRGRDAHKRIGGAHARANRLTIGIRPKAIAQEAGIALFRVRQVEFWHSVIGQGMAEKGVEHTRDACAKAKVASDEAIDLLENSCETAAKRATEYNHRLIEIVRTNTRAAFDNVNELLGAKSPTQFIELSTAQMRKQFEIVSAQNKELCALAQETATESAKPLNTGVSKAFKKAT